MFDDVDRYMDEDRSADVATITPAEEAAIVAMGEVYPGWKGRDRAYCLWHLRRVVDGRDFPERAVAYELRFIEAGAQGQQGRRAVVDAMRALTEERLRRGPCSKRSST